MPDQEMVEVPADKEQEKQDKKDEIEKKNKGVLNEGLESLTKDAKMQEDFSKDTESLLTEIAPMMKDAGRREEALERILALEKKARMGFDGISTSKLCCAIIQMYWDGGQDLQKINESIVILYKRRGQLKRAMIDMVRLCMDWIEKITDKKKKMDFIDGLCEVTDGKIFVEVERARLTRSKAAMLEKDGDLETAADIMQEVQVETFSAMERHEKAEFILEQMRLVLLREDFIRTQIISKKLNPKLLEAEDFQDKKLTFYQYMVRYWISEENYFEVAKCFQHMFNTEKVKADESQWKPILTSFVVYLIMAKYDTEQDALLAKVKDEEEKRLEKIPFVHSLLTAVLEKELTPWPLPQQADLLKLDIFSTTPPAVGEKRFKSFKKSIVQSNIRVCAGYYTRITIKRLSSLLHLTEDEVESELSELVWSKTCVLKIDRPAGIVKFGKREDTKDRLNKWSSSITDLLDLVDTCTHLIEKEKMMQQARTKMKAVAA